MRNKLAIIAAASVPLILSATGAFGAEAEFRTPSTDRAQQTQTLLSRAAHAVNTAAPRTRAEHVSNLWLFPTADEDTVFAQYTVTTDHSSRNARAPEKHFELLRMKGDRIVEQHDLIHAGDDAALHAKRSASAHTRRTS